MAGFPWFEFAGHILPSRRAQFGDDAGMLRGEPVLKLVERFDGRENGGRDFNGFRFHGGNLSWLAGKGKGFSLHVLLLKLFRRGRGGRWCRGRRVVAAVVGREDAEQKFAAHAGVGGVAGRPFQIGGVLDGQNKFVKRGGVGVLLRGGVFRAADLLHAVLFRRAKGTARGLEGGGFGIRPAFLFERGQVRGVGHRAEHDVAAGEKRTKVIVVMRAGLKFLMELNSLATGEGELGGLGGLRHALVERGQILLLGGGEVAEFAFGGFLAGDVAGNLGAKRVGGGDVGGVQPRADFGVALGGGDDESALVGEDGGRKVRAMGPSF